MLLMSQLDLVDPFNQLLLRVTFFTAQLFLLLVAGFMYYLIISENNQRKIVVPPQATPSFLSTGPPAAPEEMTVRHYDQSELKKFVTQIVIGVAICSLIHFKWDIAQPLFIQIVMSPFTLWESALFKLLVLKISEQKDPSLKRPFVVKIRILSPHYLVVRNLRLLLQNRNRRRTQRRKRRKRRKIAKEQKKVEGDTENKEENKKSK